MQDSCCFNRFEHYLEVIVCRWRVDLHNTTPKRLSEVCRMYALLVPWCQIYDRRPEIATGKVCQVCNGCLQHQSCRFVGAEMKKLYKKRVLGAECRDEPPIFSPIVAATVTQCKNSATCNYQLSLFIG